VVRLLAVDIDGTLTGEDRRLNLRAVEALRKVEERGIPVTLASGNVLEFVRAASIMIGTSGPLIAEDGGVVFGKGKTLVLGSRRVVDRGLEVLRKTLGEIRETRSSPLRLTGATLERSTPVGRVKEILKAEGVPLEAVDSGFAIHLKEPSVNKGVALKVVAELVGVPLSEAVAIADGPNDVELLSAAGLGIAVGNAPEEVKRVSKLVVDPPDGEGVVKAIRLILGVQV
jgi:hypothetical protein